METNNSNSEQVFELPGHKQKQELLKRIPGWSNRWGLLSLSIMLLCLTPLLFVKIPVKITGEVMLKMDHPQIGTEGLIVIATFEEKNYTKLLGVEEIGFSLLALPEREFGSFQMPIDQILYNKEDHKVWVIGQPPDDLLNLELLLHEGMSGSSEVIYDRIALAQSILDLF